MSQSEPPPSRAEEIPTAATILTDSYGKRTWTRVGQRPHVTRDGRHIILIEWQTGCAFCGEPVIVTGTVGATTLAKNSDFGRPTCARHRPTREQTQVLGYERMLGCGLRMFRAMRAEMMARDAVRPQADANG